VALALAEALDEVPLVQLQAREPLTALEQLQLLHTF
jgi:hypothetical protein